MRQRAAKLRQTNEGGIPHPALPLTEVTAGALSCRGRCLCPSCHQKRALQTALRVSQEVCAAVPHRQFVFTIPKRLRIYFRVDRQLLGELCRAAWEVIRTVFQSVSGHPEAVPGMIGAIQSFGDLIHAHPHIHALVTEGVFLPDGTYVE